MSLRRQGSRYLVVGGLQWLLDWAVMVALSHLGMAVAAANVSGRVSGALLGYWLNGKVTFADGGVVLGPTQFRRFAVMWLCTTAASTLAVAGIDGALGLTYAWLAKPLVEILLGVVGFVASRHWVYKP